MIYVIFGASGSGKTTLMNSVYNECGLKSINVKGTTRDRRIYDDIEIVSYPDGLPEEKFGDKRGYIYTQYGYEYGIEKKQIYDAVEGDYPHFVICNDIDTISKIRNDFAGKVFVIYLYFDAPKEQILEIQRRRGITDDEINLRVSKIEYFHEQFIHNSSFFDEVIKNSFGENPSITLWRRMKAIMASHEEEKPIPTREILFELVDHLTHTIQEVEVNRISRIDKIEKGFIFVIMPMLQGNKKIEEQLHNVNATITSVAYELGYRSQRVDGDATTDTIDNKILEQIKKAEIIIADLSFERPNCYYELGYARALGKDVIIIYDSKSKVHFDVNHYDSSQYFSMIDLEQILKTKLINLKRKHELLKE